MTQRNRTPQQLASIIHYCNQRQWKIRNLRGADLRGAYLDGACLSGADLSGADLRGAYLDGACLSGADLSGAGLRYANLRYANLGGANLGGANLGDANLRGANLRFANLYGAHLYGADLYGAHLYGADLRAAYLRGADLREVVMNWDSHNLIAERLRQAAGTDSVKRIAAGYIAISTDWCWEQLLDNAPDIALTDGTPLKQWALDTMREWVRNGDHAPDILKGGTSDDAA